MRVLLLFLTFVLVFSCKARNKSRAKDATEISAPESENDIIDHFNNYVPALPFEDAELKWMANTKIKCASKNLIVSTGAKVFLTEKEALAALEENVKLTCKNSQILDRTNPVALSALFSSQLDQTMAATSRGTFFVIDRDTHGQVDGSNIIVEGFCRFNYQNLVNNVQFSKGVNGVTNLVFLQTAAGTQDSRYPYFTLPVGMKDIVSSCRVFTVTRYRPVEGNHVFNETASTPKYYWFGTQNASPFDLEVESKRNPIHIHLRAPYDVKFDALVPSQYWDAKETGSSRLRD